MLGHLPKSALSHPLRAKAWQEPAGQGATSASGIAGVCPTPDWWQVQHCWPRQYHLLPPSPPGAKKVTNKATLWYVPLSLKNVNKVLEVPPIQVGQLAWVPQNWNLSSLGNGTNLALLALPAVPVALPTPFLPAFYSSMRERSRRTRGRSVTRSKNWIGWKLSREMVT